MSKLHLLNDVVAEGMAEHHAAVRARCHEELAKLSGCQSRAPIQSRTAASAALAERRRARRWRELGAVAVVACLVAVAIITVLYRPSATSIQPGPSTAGNVPLQGLPEDNISTSRDGTYHIEYVQGSSSSYTYETISGGYSNQFVVSTISTRASPTLFTVDYVSNADSGIEVKWTDSPQFPGYQTIVTMGPTGPTFEFVLLANK